MPVAREASPANVRLPKRRLRFVIRRMNVTLYPKKIIKKRRVQILFSLTEITAFINFD